MGRFLLIAILVATILFVGSLVLSSQLTQPTPAVRPKTPLDWHAYKNTKYGFEFRYPPGFVLTADDGQISNPGDASDIVVGPAFTSYDKLPAEFEIIVQVRNSSSPDFYDDPPSFWQRPLKDLIPAIGAFIGNEQPVGRVVTTTVAGEPAFEFKVNKSIGWNGFGRAIDEDNLLVFLETSD